MTHRMVSDEDGMIHLVGPAPQPEYYEDDQRTLCGDGVVLGLWENDEYRYPNSDDLRRVECPQCIRKHIGLD